MAQPNLEQVTRDLESLSLHENALIREKALDVLEKLGNQTTNIDDAIKFGNDLEKFIRNPGELGEADFIRTLYHVVWLLGIKFPRNSVDSEGVIEDPIFKTAIPPNLLFVSLSRFQMNVANLFESFKFNRMGKKLDPVNAEEFQDCEIEMMKMIAEEAGLTFPVSATSLSSQSSTAATLVGLQDSQPIFIVDIDETDETYITSLWDFMPQTSFGLFQPANNIPEQASDLLSEINEHQQFPGPHL